MSQFSIGPFEFINLSRPPSRSKLRTEREIRPGVAGTTMWGLGRQAAPYQTMSVCDVEDAAAGELLLEDYEAIVGTQAYELYWAGVFNSMVYVHDVVPLENGIYQTLQGIGGILGSSNGMIRCIWTLEALQVQPPQQEQ
jgi:hypothetical protein